LNRYNPKVVIESSQYKIPETGDDYIAPQGRQIYPELIKMGKSEAFSRKIRIALRRCLTQNREIHTARGI